MKAKDTVMPFKRIEQIDFKNAESNFTDALVDVAREQAEISFKAGYNQALKEHEWDDNYSTGKQAGIKAEQKRMTEALRKLHKDGWTLADVIEAEDTMGDR